MVYLGVVDNDDENAKRALRVLFELAEAVKEDGRPVYDEKVRYRAAQTILDFSKSKPASKISAEISSPEAFLALIAKTE